MWRTKEEQAKAAQAKSVCNQFLCMILCGHIAARLEKFDFAAIWSRRA